MRRNLDKPQVPWSADVLASDKDALNAMLPMRGAQTWVIEQGLVKFLDLIEASPLHERWAHQDIQRMLYEDKSPELRPELKDLNIQIPTALYIRFSQILPEFGGASWFIRKFLHAFVEDLASTPSFEERVESVVNRAFMPQNEPELVSEAEHFGADQ